MTRKISRRAMLGACAATSIQLAGYARTSKERFNTAPKKALVLDKIDEKTLTQFKQAGFDGVEVQEWDIKPAHAEWARRVAENCGMQIHSVMRGWANFNDAEKLEADMESVRVSLAAASAYGADAILLVPCRVSAMPIPEPWTFDIAFDKDTGHVQRVVKGDNTPYRKYIEAQNHATDTAREALKRLAPAAEKAGVLIGVENVWNNLWVQPPLADHFVRSIDSPWVKFYFDIGNHVKYGPGEEWFRILGDQIIKLHVKDFALGDQGHGGNFVNIGDGSINWPSIRSEIERIGYNGWMTIEGSGELSVDERSARLDNILAGRPPTPL